jgi:hypothetical protein
MVRETTQYSAWRLCGFSLSAVINIHVTFIACYRKLRVHIRAEVVFFQDVVRCRLTAGYRRCGKTYLSHLKTSGSTRRLTHINLSCPSEYHCNNWLVTEHRQLFRVHISNLGRGVSWPSLSPFQQRQWKCIKNTTEYSCKAVLPHRFL